MIGFINCNKIEYFENVKAHLIKMEELFPSIDIAFIGLQGSQNYGLDTAESDFDTTGLVLPSFRDISFNEKAVSGTEILDNEEHLVYKDIRVYINELKKGSINGLDLLFSKCSCTADLYKKEMAMLIDNREEIAYMQPRKVVRSAMYYMLNNYKKGNSKSLSHALRMCDFIPRYIDGERYEDILSPIDKELILKVKYDKINYNNLLLTKERVEKTEKICAKYLEGKDNDNNITLLEEAQIAFMRKALYLSLEGSF